MKPQAKQKRARLYFHVSNGIRQLKEVLRSGVIREHTRYPKLPHKNFQ